MQGLAESQLGPGTSTKHRVNNQPDASLHGPSNRVLRQMSHLREYLSTVYGLRFVRKSTGANGEKRFSTKLYRKPALLLQKYPNNSGNLREFTGECNLGIPYSSSLLTRCAKLVTGPAWRGRGQQPTHLSPPTLSKPPRADTGVCEKHSFYRSFLLQPTSRNCYPAPGLVFLKLIFPHVLLSGGVCFSQTPVSCTPCPVQSRLGLPWHNPRRAHPKLSLRLGAAVPICGLWPPGLRVFRTHACEGET